MSSSILPHLLYLKATFGNLAASTRKDPIVELQIRAARRLLDYMMTQISAASGLREECYAELQAILPQVESEVGPQAGLEGALLQCVPTVSMISSGSWGTCSAN